MATRTCPECEAQYVATVRRCIDCDVMLVDAPGPEVDGEVDGAMSAAAPVGTGDQVGYELEGWGNQLKVTLEGMLARAGIGRVWEAGALVVAAADEEAVDDLIATLEGGDVADLPDDAPRVALEIEGLDADGQAELDAQLLAGSVPHAWDEDGALLVAEADEERVLELIDEVFDGSVDDTDGLAAMEALSAVYVAVDRLVKDPHERKLATAYVRAAGALDPLAVPYGFAAADWTALVDDVEALATRVEPHADIDASTGRAAGDDGGDDEVADDGGAEHAHDDEPQEGVTVDEAPDADGHLDDHADGPGAPDGGDDAADGPAGDDEPVEQVRSEARALRERLADLV